MKISNAITDKLSFNRQAKEPPKEPAKDDTIKSLDTNKDGKLDRKEFSSSTLYKSADEQQRDVLDRAFAAMANKSGEIATDEALKGLATLLDENPKPTATLLDSAYDAVTGFVGNLFGGMKKAASDFIDWATGQLEKISNGFFDQFVTNVVRKPEKTKSSEARSRLKETEADELEALEKLKPQDREAYQAIVSELGSDPVARLTLRNLLLDGRLPGDNDLAAGKSLLANLSTLAKQPLADGIDRQDLLADILSHVEDPINISQKQQNTCGPTTGQLLLAKQEPAEYVRLAAGLASPEGSVTLQNGDTIKREAEWKDANEDARTVGNQLFQSALMEYANGKFDYSNVDDTRKVEIGPLSLDIPGMLPAEMANLAESLTGRDHGVNYSLMSDKVSPEFEAALAKAGPGSEVPIIVNYNVKDSGVESTMPHYLLVTGYDAKTGMVSISNPWGREEKVALDELQKHLIAAMPQA